MAKKPQLKRLDRRVDYEWHRQINLHMQQDVPLNHRRHRFMYTAMEMADEVPRMAMLFALERKGELPTTHQQCSHSPREEIPENKLSCCLGVECAACPMLQALEGMEADSEAIDSAKAWTCAAHIAAEGGDKQGEGFLLTVGDRLYWDRVYESLAATEELE